MTIDPARFRQLFGHFATGVTVITTEVDGWLHGMTANAVTSVSLNPLLLLVCVDKTAHAHEQLTKAGRFGVNILSEEQEDISRIFAETAEAQQGTLRGAAYHLGPQATPVIDSCLAYLECEVAQQVDAGDHTIFIGRVLDGEVEGDSRPLLFYRGGYHRLDS